MALVDAVQMKLIYILLLMVSLGAFSQENVAKIGNMPDEVKENSGLLFYNGKLITHNDSGNTPQLFEIDTLSLAVTRVITIENAENIDWEDLAQDDDYIYIGDFGNNNGDRQNLRVYRISKIDYDSNTTISADIIDIAYEDQLDFSTNANSDWDAEALFVLNDNLVILTKQWQSMGTVAYSFPKEPGVYIASRIGEYAVQGLVTGATINVQSNELFVVGYSQTLAPFLLEIPFDSPQNIFGGDINKTILNIGLAQVEAITQINENTFHVSSEGFVNNVPAFTLEAALFSFQLDREIIDVKDKEKETLVVFKAYNSDVLGYQLNTGEAVFGSSIFSVSGQKLYNAPGIVPKEGILDISSFETATYYLVFYLNSGVVSKPFIKN
ncbi:MAG: secretion protein [Flavobacteriaceae bacterium]|nr:MAG: secretion protein [Flavobacteriaceae bacterium]